VRAGASVWTLRPQSILPPSFQPQRFQQQIWHVDCFAVVMTDDRYVSLLVWTICVLMFACGVVAITQHPEWFGT
jgi:hypothetical protein